MYRNDYRSNEREGAFAEDLKRLYDLFPPISNVIYQFHEREDEENFFELTIFKYACTAKEAKEHIDRYLAGYGKGPFTLNIEWRKGFGNTIIIDVYRCF